MNRFGKYGVTKNVIIHDQALSGCHSASIVSPTNVFKHALVALQFCILLPQLLKCFNKIENIICDAMSVCDGIVHENFNFIYLIEVGD